MRPFPLAGTIAHQKYLDGKPKSTTGPPRLEYYKVSPGPSATPVVVNTSVFDFSNANVRDWQMPSVDHRYLRYPSDLL